MKDKSQMHHTNKKKKKREEEEKEEEKRDRKRKEILVHSLDHNRCLEGHVSTKK